MALLNTIASGQDQEAAGALPKLCELARRPGGCSDQGHMPTEM
jgi:hypothetical protein